MSYLTQIFSAAYHELVSKDPAFYTDRYKKYYGLEWKPLILEDYDFSWPEYDDLPEDYPIRNGKLGIGVFIHEPYYYYEKEAGADEDDPGTVVGFEYELGNAMMEIVKAHYEKEFDVKWNELRFFEMPGDGMETFVLQEALDSSMGEYYDIVFSSCFYTDPADPVERRIPPVAVDSAHPDLRFFASAAYTGKDDFGAPDLDGIDINDPDAYGENLDKIALWFTKKAYEQEFHLTPEKKIHIWHTPQDAQKSSAEVLKNKINEYAKYTLAIESGQMVDVIQEAIEHKTIHVYVGDLLAAQRMNRTFEGCHYLPLNLNHPMVSSLAPYTFPDPE